MQTDNHKIAVHLGTLTRARGFSLLELLISLIIMSLGLLGLAGLQVKTLQTNQSSYYRGVAADLASDLADRIRANRPGVIASSNTTLTYPFTVDYAQVTGMMTGCSQSGISPFDFTCTSSTQGTNNASTVNGATQAKTIAANDLQQWLNDVKNQLPSGNATITNPAGVDASLVRQIAYEVTLTWLDDRHTNSTGTYKAVIK